MRLVLGLTVLLAACVADVAGTHQSQQNGEGSGSQMTDDESTASGIVAQICAPRSTPLCSDVNTTSARPSSFVTSKVASRDPRFVLN